MAKVRIILDKRRISANNKYPIKLYIYHRGQIYMPTPFTAAAKEWDAPAGAIMGSSSVVKAQNARLRDMLARAETLLLNLTISGELRKMTDKALRAALDGELCIARGGALLVDYIEKAKIGKAPRTQRLFTWARQQVERIDARVRVEDVDEAWMQRYREELEKNYKPNTVAQGIAWVSRALTLAMADGIINSNPAKGVRKPKEETRKRSLSLEQLRWLRDVELTPARARVRDIFMLQFYLMGINMVDLYNLTGINDGRIEYRRCKTGKLYSVKVEPEAMDIIRRYAGEDRLLKINKSENAASTCSCTTRILSKIMPGLGTNYARHTWATIAAELEIPIETISHALGHQIGSPVTAIYIAYNQRKVDEANRRVIDYVNADLADCEK